ncbi:MAG TPA: dihydropteroate synthase, partial [Thermoanaerobaculia bacterium]|nr:dihydropteroate synthase [Thermoanaerobaculia bacterium]
MNEEHGTRNDDGLRSVFRVPRSVFGPVVMGILNVTPDSFSDGGLHFDRTTAVDAALRMHEDG